jgi:phenylpropionate dioxygenase-like ring-hydroxylating dioxygenase large terminal subunit
MFSNITPNHYFENDIFELEKEKIFSDNWIFICFKDDVANHNDFVSKKIGKIPVVIQNINGEIKAFMNVCSHRFSILQTQERGNRALFCPYHGWAFSKDGIPTGIPKKPLFKEFNEQELCDLKLKEYSLEACGDFLFIHINEPKITLKEYLGKFYNDLEKISDGKDKRIDINKINIKANWKVLVENTLESYHVNLVHSNTFKKLGAKGLKFDFTDYHSKWDADLNLGEDDLKLSKIHNNFKNRSFKINGYIHYLIYPNLLVSTSYGVSFNFSTIFPTTPSESEFISHVFMSKSENNNALIKYYKQSLIDFNRQVFDEDKTICEEVQKGVIITDKPGVLSLEEERVHAFQNTYMQQIKNKLII